MIDKYIKLGKLNKHSAIGDAVINIYRILLVILIAFVVLGVAAVFYNYSLDVRNVEAEILARNVINCMTSKEYFDLDGFMKQDKQILDYCGIRNTERLYASVIIVTPEYSTNPSYVPNPDYQPNKGLQLMKTFEQGDSGILWVKEVLFRAELMQSTGSSSQDVDILKKYEPGFFSEFYPVIIMYSGKKIKAEVNINVVIGNEL